MKAVLAAIEGMNRLNKNRGTSFHIGQRITVDGKPGVIVGANESSNLDVLFDGGKRAFNCHPTWKVEVTE